jgi:integrase
VTALPENLLGARDAALLLVGFAGAFRRSELVALNWEDVKWGWHCAVSC